MKRIRLFSLILILLLTLSSCVDSLPVMADTETDGETETETTVQTDEETAPETESDEPKKRVAITFDDGPSFTDLTYNIVDEFAKYGGKATFFVLGWRINGDPSTGKAMQYAYERGFEFGIHAYSHELYFDTCTEAEFLKEVNDTKAAINRYIDAEVTLLRAPGGRIPKSRALLAGYPVINWSIDSLDWKYKGRSDEATIKSNIGAIVENALRGVEDGDIILLHEIYQNSYEATCIILERLDEMGFEFVTVTELLGAENLTAGETYYRAP